VEDGFGRGGIEFDGAGRRLVVGASQAGVQPDDNFFWGLHGAVNVFESSEAGWQQSARINNYPRRLGRLAHRRPPRRRVLALRKPGHLYTADDQGAWTFTTAVVPNDQHNNQPGYDPFGARVVNVLISGDARTFLFNWCGGTRDGPGGPYTKGGVAVY
jgi:hypothetical protein